MRYNILLNKNENTKEVETQEQYRFVKSILEALEVPVDWDPEEPFTFDGKIDLLKALTKYNINVISDIDGGVKIYVQDDLIAEWKKATYKLKKDAAQIDPAKRLYLQMTVNFWSIFENRESDA